MSENPQQQITPSTSMEAEKEILLDNLEGEENDEFDANWELLFEDDIVILLGKLMHISIRRKHENKKAIIRRAWYKNSNCSAQVLVNEYLIQKKRTKKEIKKMNCFY